MLSIETHCEIVEMNASDDIEKHMREVIESKTHMLVKPKTQFLPGYANFFVDGKVYSYAPSSLTGLTETSRFRKLCVSIIVSKYFKIAVALVVVANAVIISLTDFSDVDDNGDLLYNSPRNQVLRNSDPFFVAVFIFEAVIKISAMGFYSKDGGSYLSDGWNILDFAVAISAVVSSGFGSGSGTRSVRAIRALRPLKLLSFVPGINVMLESISVSLPELMHVSIVVGIFMFLYAIFGIVLFGGPYLHTRCRLTPFPVNRSWVAGLDPEPYRCIKEPTFNVIQEEPTWKYKSQSPWSEPKYCYWPIDQVDPDNQRWCSLPHSNGRHQCPPDRWCGSNYDALGNARFYDLDMDDASEIFVENLSWGYSLFDHIGYALVVVILIMSNAAWDLTTQNLSDARGAVAVGNPESIYTVIYSMLDCQLIILYTAFMVFLSLLGTFGMLQMFLAVMNHSYEYITTKKKRLDEETKKDSGPLKLTIELVRDNMKRKVQIRGPFYKFLNWLSSRVKKIVKTVIFNRFVNILTLFNTIVLSINHYPMSATFQNSMEIVSFVLLIAFTIELIMKLTAFGIFKYFENEFNILDFLVVILSILELIVDTPVFLGGHVQNSSPASALRALRLFRIFRLFKVLSTNKKLNILVTKLWLTGKDLRNFVVILLLFMFMYSVIGMELFANRLRFDIYGQPIREIHSAEWYNAATIFEPNFDDFHHAFAAVLQVLTLDSWDGLYPKLWLSAGPWTLLYIFSLILFGTFMLLELFKAILLGNFGMEETELDEKASLHSEDSASDDENSRRDFLEIKNHQLGSSKREYELAKFEESPSKSSHDMLFLSNPSESATSPNSSVAVLTPSAHMIEDAVESSSYGNDKDVDTDYAPNSFDLRDDFSASFLGRLRKSCVEISENKYFNAVLMIITILSAITLVFDNPLNDPNGKTQTATGVIDIVVFVFFFIEAIIKMTGLGLYSSKEKHYFSDMWNVLDLFILVISALPIFNSDPAVQRQAKGLRALRSIRSLKAFRVLKFVRHFNGLRLVIETLIESIPEVLYSMLLCLIILFIFALFCVNFWKGQLKSCSGENFDNIISVSSNYTSLLINPVSWSSMTPEQMLWFGPSNPITNASHSTCASFGWPQNPCCPSFQGASKTITSRDICECWGGRWDNVCNQSFDNVFQGILAVFEMATFENWIDVLYAVTANTGINMQPIQSSEMYWVYFFFLLLIVCGLFCISLFVGVIVDNYNRISARRGYSALLTEEQIMWVRTQKVLMKLRPHLRVVEPRILILNIFYQLKNSFLYRTIEFCILLVGILAISCTNFGQSELITRGIYNTNIFCSSFALVNIVLTFMSDRHKFFVKVVNVSDLVMCVIGDAIFLNDMVNGFKFTIIPIGVVRLVRINRMWEILNYYNLRYFEGTIDVVRTLLISIPGMFNVSCLLCLLLFIYATMGVQLFAKVAYYNSYYDGANFRSFWNSFELMFQLGTVNSWSMFMHDAAHAYPGCDPDPSYNAAVCGFSDHDGCVPLNGCGSQAAMFTFVISFVLLVSLVILNLLVAIVLGTYDEIISDDNVVNTENLAEYLRTWSLFDPEATKLVDLHKVPEFLKALNPPLGCGDDEDELKNVLSNLNLHVIDNHVHFRDLLAQLAVAATKKKLFCEGKRGVLLALPEKSKVLGRHKDNAVFMKGSYLLSDSSEVKFSDTQILSDVDVNMLEAEKLKKEMEELEEHGKAAIRTEKKRRSLEILNWRQQAREVEKKLTIREENERKKRSAMEAEKQMRVNATAARLRRLAEEEEEERRALVEEEEAEKRRIAAEVEAALNPALQENLRRPSISSNSRKGWRQSFINTIGSFSVVEEDSTENVTAEEERRILEEEEAAEKRRIAADIVAVLKTEHNLHESIVDSNLLGNVGVDGSSPSKIISESPSTQERRALAEEEAAEKRRIVAEVEAALNPVLPRSSRRLSIMDIIFDNTNPILSDSCNAVDVVRQELEQENLRRPSISSNSRKGWRQSFINTIGSFSVVEEDSTEHVTAEEERRILEEEEAAEKRRIAAEIVAVLKTEHPPHNPEAESINDTNLLLDSSVLGVDGSPPSTVTSDSSTKYQSVTSYIPNYEEALLLAEEEAEEKRRLEEEIAAALAAPKNTSSTMQTKKTSFLGMLFPSIIEPSGDFDQTSLPIDTSDDFDSAERRLSFQRVLSADEENSGYIFDDDGVNDEVTEHMLLAQEELEEKKKISAQLASLEINTESTNSHGERRRGSMFKSLSTLAWSKLRNSSQAKLTQEETQECKPNDLDLLSRTVDLLESDFNKEQAEEEARFRELEQNVHIDEELRLAVQDDHADFSYDIYSTAH